jgi:hypothetical protein
MSLWGLSLWSPRPFIFASCNTYERHLVHAIKARVSPGEPVTSLINQHCRAWGVRSNAVRGQSEVSAEIPAELNLAGVSAA